MQKITKTKIILKKYSGTEYTTKTNKDIFLAKIKINNFENTFKFDK